MQKFIFTFTQNHPLKNHCQAVYAEDQHNARLRMCERYGRNWGFQYTEEEWEEYQVRAKKFGIQAKVELAPIYASKVREA